MADELISSQPYVKCKDQTPFFSIFRYSLIPILFYSTYSPYSLFPSCGTR